MKIIKGHVASIQVLPNDVPLVPGFPTCSRESGDQWHIIWQHSTPTSLQRSVKFLFSYYHIDTSSS